MTEYEGAFQPDKSESPALEIIPEIKLALCPESEIPPPAPGVELEEELEAYRKIARQYWEAKNQSETENEQRERIGYIPPRLPDGTLDWDRTWELLKRQTPKRSVIFPNGEDVGMSEQDIVRRLNDYLGEHELPLHTMSGLNAKEYPEVIDHDIRPICVEINQLKWIQTGDSCSGHRERILSDGTAEPDAKGFSLPYLMVYLDRKDPRSQIFMARAETIVHQIQEQYPFVTGGVRNTALDDEDLEREDLAGLDVGIRVNPSPEWLDQVKREKGSDYFNDAPELPDRLEDSIMTIHPPRPEGYSDAAQYIEDYARAYRIFNYQRDLWQRYEARYNEKYGEYFRSEGSERIAQEFFLLIKRLIDEIDSTSK